MDTAVDPPHSAVLIPGIELHELIGKGGSSHVYRATSTTHSNRVFAVKILKDPLDDSESLIRFNRETYLLRKLDHPQIAKLHQFGIASNGQPYLVLQYIDGERIDRYCHRHFPLVEKGTEPTDWKPRIELFAKVCRAIQYAHSQGVLHRDLKPGNVMVDRDGQVYITDFGLAKSHDATDAAIEETRTGTIMGTLNYLAPEQVFSNRAELGAATDVFGLGATLHVLLTGDPPFRFANFAEATMHYFRRLPIKVTGRLAVPSELEAICLKCLSPNAADRYASAGELADELQRFLDGHTVKARTQRFIRRASLLNKQYPGFFRTSLIVTGVMLILAVVFYWNWQETRETLHENQNLSASLESLLIKLSDEVRQVEDSPETIEHRERLLNIMRLHFQELDEELDTKPLLLREAALVDYKLGQIESHKANAVESRQHFANAALKFARVKRVAPDDFDTEFDLFHTYLRMNEIEQARGIGEALLLKHPDNLDYCDSVCSVNFILAREHVARGKFSEAEPYIERAMQLAEKLEPHAPLVPRFSRKVAQAHAFRAQKLIVDNQLEAAKVALDSALAQYAVIDPLSSPVESETCEWLELLTFAYSLAALQADHARAIELDREFESIYSAASQRYLDRPQLYFARLNQLAQVVEYAKIGGHLELRDRALSQWKSILDRWAETETESSWFRTTTLKYWLARLQSPSFEPTENEWLIQVVCENGDQFTMPEYCRICARLGMYNSALERAQTEFEATPWRPDVAACLATLQSCIEGSPLDGSNEISPDDERSRQLLSMTWQYAPLCMARNLQLDLEACQAGSLSSVSSNNQVSMD